MTDVNDISTKVHYICQTYVAKKAAHGTRGGLRIDKLLQYATAVEAQNRAQREFDAGNCIGADVYMVTEDCMSGEVDDPTFLLRLGTIPDEDGF